MSKIKAIFIVLIICLTLFGCNTIPKDAFQLSEASLKIRQLQSRKFDTKNEVAILAAGVGVLQDMGYSIETSEKKLGLITASKMSDATNATQVGLAIFVALGGGSMPTDKEQKIRVTFVTHGSENEDSFLARVTFQRTVWNTKGQITRAEALADPELYEGFFEKLSKSIFLEAHKI